MSGCWLWIGAADKHGYSRFRLGGTQPKKGHARMYRAYSAIEAGDPIDIDLRGAVLL